MKGRYKVFSGMAYYPLGGAEDFVSSHEELDEARAVAATEAEDWGEWSQVWDAEADEVVARFGPRMD